VRTLRDVTPGMLAAHAALLSGIEVRRARHVVTENARVSAFVDALSRDDLQAAGAAMDASHISLRDDYQVSGPQLDVACQLARQHPACFGARLTGAGFGGCAIALVHSDAADDFIGHVQPRYEAATYLPSRFFIARPAPGAAIDARTGTPARPAGG
jgi:galactokinase